MFASKLSQTLTRLSTSQAKNLQSVCRQASIMACSQRAFSQVSSINSGAGKLNRALEKEVKYEHDNYTQLEDIENFLQESGFTFHETEDSIKMSLTKTVQDKQIEIQFESR